MLKYRIFWVWALFSAYQCSSDRMDKDPVLQEARRCADSCRVFLPKLEALHDSLAKNQEWEALKISNNYEMTRSNLAALTVLIDSADQHADKIPHPNDFKLVIQSQTQYLYALLSAGDALLHRNSQSFGEWREKPTAIPDSVLTPVKKTTDRQAGH